MLKQLFLIRNLRAACGYTLVGTVVATFVGAVVLTGAWIGYRNIAQVTRVAFVDRQMDQYGHMCMQELTNLMGWGWGAVQVQGGPSPRWEIVMDDAARVDGGLQHWVYWNRLDDRGRLVVTMHPYRGILYDRQEPLWADGQFIFRGVNSAGVDEVSTMDRRDRMTMEGMEVEILDDATVKVTITLQYHYQAVQANGHMTGLFVEEYVRERTYSTKVYLQNWDVKANTFKESVRGS